jgi:hypothetical protein
MIKSRRMRWAGHNACIGNEMHTRLWSGNLMEMDHLEDLGIDGTIILKWILKKWDGRYGLDCCGSG